MVFLGQNPNPITRLSLCQVYTPMIAMSHSPSRALRWVSLVTVPPLQLEEHVLPTQTAREFGQRRARQRGAGQNGEQVDRGNSAPE